MKKPFTFITLIACILIGTQAHSQLRFGVKGGLNFANINGLSNLGALDVSGYTGWHAGIFLGAKVSMITIQGDLLYSVEGAKFSVSSFDITQENSYFNIPVVVKFSFIPLLNLHAGLQYGILTKAAINGQEEFDFGGGLVSVKDQLKGGNTSIVIGAGLDVSKLMVEVRYLVGLTDLNNDPTVNTALKSGVLQLSAGFRIK